MRQFAPPGPPPQSGEEPETWAAPWRAQDVAFAVATLGALLLAQAVMMQTARAPERYRGIEGVMFAVFPTTVTAIGVLIRAHQRGLSLGELGIRPPSTWRPSLVAWLIAIAAGPLNAFGSSLLASAGALPEAGARTPSMHGLAPDGLLEWLAVTAILAVVVPITEELIFRGLVHRAFRTRWPRLPAMVLSALVFSGAHLEGATLLPLFVVGFVLAWAYERSGSLWGSIAPHGGLNGLTLLVLLTR